jgi:hypothetical protein
MTQNVKFDLL